MYIVFLRFSSDRHRAGELMADHQAWITRGFDEGIFLFVGSLEARRGGVVIAQSATREAIEARVREDPFVAHDVVTAEIVEVTPAKTEPRLAFLLG